MQSLAIYGIKENIKLYIKTIKLSDLRACMCCHGGLLIALTDLASNFGRIIFGWVGPVLASKTSPAGPNYVDQTWSGRTDFFPGPIFSLQAG